MHANQSGLTKEKFGGTGSHARFLDRSKKKPKILRVLKSE